MSQLGREAALVLLEQVVALGNAPLGFGRTHVGPALHQNDAECGIWRLSRGKHSESVKVHGNLSTNDGQVALNWALDGQSILLRAEWNLATWH